MDGQTSDVEPPSEESEPARTSASENGALPLPPDPFEDRITAFRLRAEKVMIRLQKIEAGAVPADGPTEVVRLR
jgi:hypothetical protein